MQKVCRTLVVVPNTPCARLKPGAADRSAHSAGLGPRERMMQKSIKVPYGQILWWCMLRSCQNDTNWVQNDANLSQVTLQ